MSRTVLYYSPRCNNSMRFVEALRRTRLSGSTTLVNIDTTRVDGLKFLPTLVVDDRPYVGSEAFTYLKQFDADMSLDTYEGAGARAFCSLPFSQLSDAGCAATYAENFDAFVRPN